jgi:glucokinase
MSFILAGDIGGSKTHFALYEYAHQGLLCINQKTYSSHDFGQFNDVLTHFMRNTGITELEVVSLSLAGPVIDTSCQITNLPWHISNQAILNTLKVKQVILLNDIQATGYGLLHAAPSTLVQINPDANYHPGNQAIISIGTGLGEAFLFWDGQQHIPCGTEGGHTDFAPLIAEDLALWRYLKNRFSGHISYERLLSGPGIALLYDYLCQQHPLANKAPEMSASAWISEHAIHQTDKLSIECMHLFLRFLASEAANLCLKTMATGGIYITGGIAPKILPLFTQETFMTHLIEKGRFKDLMKRIPVWINKSERTPLEGALQQAMKLLRSGTVR